MPELKVIPFLGIQKHNETDYAVYCTLCWRHCVKYYLGHSETPNISEGMLSTGIRLGVEGTDENCPYLNQ